MKIVDKITRLIRGRPLTDEKRAARAEAEARYANTEEQAAEFVARDRAQGGPF